MKRMTNISMKTHHGDRGDAWSLQNIELCNPDDDPEELYDLAEDSPQKVEELKREREEGREQRRADNGG